MKKELIFLILPIVLVVAGVLYKSFYLSDTLNTTSEITALNNEAIAKFNRDSLVQKNLIGIKKLYDINRRDTRTYSEIIADLLKITESLLQKSSIEYKSNDINQEFDEIKDIKAGTTTFVINLNFTTDYLRLMNFIKLIEKNELFIRISSLEIFRARVQDDSSPGSFLSGKKEFDEFNVKALVNVKAKLEFVKFL